MQKITYIEMDIYAMRKQYGLKIGELANRLGICRHTLTKMEKNKQIPIDYYARFSSELPLLFPIEKLDQRNGSLTIH